MNIFSKFALKSLLKNRSHTVINLIGITLAAMMVTAVTTGISSFYSYFTDVTRLEEGGWHSSVFFLDHDELKRLKDNKEAESIGIFSDLGYAKLPEVKRANTPYLFLADYQGDLPELLSIHTIEGRLPENDSEILVPKTLNTRGQVTYAPGQKITLETGQRLYTGSEGESGKAETIWQDYPYEEEEETFQSEGKKTFTVTGIYDSAKLGYWGADTGAGYVALTTGSEASSLKRSMAYISWKNPAAEKKQSELLETMFDREKSVNHNNRYLQILNYRADSTLFQAIWMLAAILLVIIMFSSAILIYNSFSISINERKKQYGLLSSLGASRKQLHRTILVETCVLSIVGIPLGILLGMGALTIVFYVLQAQLTELLKTSQPITLSLSAAPWAILAACALSFVTILISAAIPAKKAWRVSAVEAIRQSAEIRITPNKVHTSKLIRRLFGLEGDIAAKNYKRNKRKYRTTVFSIFISLVLFIAADSFCSYLSDSISTTTENFQCDIWIDAGNIENSEQAGDLYGKLMQSDKVTDGEYHYLQQAFSIVSVDSVSNDFYKRKNGENRTEQNILSEQTGVIFLQDEVYDAFVREQHLNVTEYIDSPNPKALIYDAATIYDPNSKHYKISNYFKQKPESLKLVSPTNRTVTLDGQPYRMDENLLGTREGKDGQWEACVYPSEIIEILNSAIAIKIEVELTGKDRWVPLESVCDVMEVPLGDRLRTLPRGIDHEAYYLDLTLIYPERARRTVAPDSKNTEFYMTFQSEDHEKSYADMELTLESMEDQVQMYNVAEANELSRATILIVRIFTYGFIFLIVLTSTVNILNVISANIILRRRELAMLRSVGMTRRGFFKMSAFESLMYGSKGVLSGVPAAIGLSALLWYFFIDAVEFAFYVRWKSVALAIGAVYLVIAGTIFYFVYKIRKENVIDNLRQE